MNLIAKRTAYKLLHFDRQCHCICNCRQCSEQWALSPAVDNIIYCDWLTVTGVQLYSVTIGNGINWELGEL
jgi:hypothetical protein